MRPMTDEEYARLMRRFTAQCKRLRFWYTVKDFVRSLKEWFRCLKTPRR